MAAGACPVVAPSAVSLGAGGAACGGVEVAAGAVPASRARTNSYQASESRVRSYVGARWCGGASERFCGGASRDGCSCPSGETPAP